MSKPTRAVFYGADLPVRLDEAFAFVSDPATWPRFFESLESATAGEGWGHVGGRGRMVTRFMGRTIASEMLLTEWEPPHAFRYTASQAGRPDLDNLRVFEVSSRGTRMYGTTELVLRSGAGGHVDRVSVHVLQHVYNRAMARLPGVIENARRTRSGARTERSPS